MAYKVILPKKEKESFGMQAIRNIGGGLARAGESISHSAALAINPEGTIKEQLQHQFLDKKRPATISETYFKPKNDMEDYFQHLVSGLSLTGVAGGLKAAGETTKGKAISLAKSTGRSLMHMISSDIAIDTAKTLGIPEPIAVLSGAILPSVISSANTKGLISNLNNTKNNLDKTALNIEKLKEQLPIRKKELYELSRSNPKAHTNQKPLRLQLEKGLELEHKQSFAGSESNRKNLEGGSNLFRKDKQNIKSSIHKPQIYSNYDLTRDIKSPGKVDVNRNIIIDDLFPGKNLINKDATINTKKLATLYKDNIKLNDLFEFKKNIGAINQRSGRKTSPALRNVERVIHEGIEHAGKKYPKEVSALRQADELHALEVSKDPKDVKLWEYATKNFPKEVEDFNKSAEIEKLLTSPSPEDKKAWEKAFHYLFKASKYLGIGTLIDRFYLTKESFKIARPETKQFLVNNIIEKIKDNPGVFQSEIRKLNEITSNKKEKKGKFKVIL